MINIREFFSKFNPDSSKEVTDKKLVASLINDPDFPYLVSFPRTGSHWLRMLMELYFEMPALVRIFYFRDSKNFTCYHSHDEDLKISGRRNLLYLYRDPVDTVFSQLKYYKEDITDVPRVETWSDLYGRHLRKWLYEDNFSRKKTVLTYEGLKKDIINEFRKVTAHFDEEMDLDRFTAVSEQVSKFSLKKKTVHDKQVVNLHPNYADERMNFRAAMADRIRSVVLAIDNRLTTCFR